MFFALCGVGVYAQQPQMGELIYDESGCLFRVISLSPGRVAVVHPPAGISSFAHYSGVVRVPDTVWYTSSRPLQVYAVADSAFFNCSSLTKVELPATLRTIGVDAFSGTSSLDTIRCYGKIPPEMYYDAINLRSSMGNLTRGDDYTRYKDVIVLRVPCSGMDNYTSVQGWARFSNTTGESMFMLYKDTICEGQNYNNHQFSLTKPSSGTYQKINIPGGLGCTYDAELHLVVHLKVWPTETSSFEDIICPNTVYRWIDGNAYTEPVLGPFTTLRTVHGCDSTVYLHLIEGEPAVADIWSDKTWVKVDEPMVRLVDHTLHGDSRVWQFPDSVSTYEELDYTYPSDYDSVRIYLIATNHDGCVDTASLLLRLDRDFIWVPNVFTPALNENNHFQVFGQGLTDVKVSIYTGTGLFIYSWEGMDGYWDGTHDGKLCPQAAYTYKVTYATERNPRGYNTQVGTVVLLR